MLTNSLFLCLICVKLISCDDDQSMWSSYQFGTGSGNREELVVTNVLSDNDFNEGKGVRQWKSVTVGGISYVVGMLENAFIILNMKLSSDKKFIVKWKKTIELEWSAESFEVFSYWNEESYKEEVVLAVAEGNPSRKLFFYTIKKQSLERLWAWHVDTTLGHMHYFQLHDKEHRLLLIHHDGNDCDAHLYKFTLTHSSRRRYWHTQTIQLSHPAFSSGINMYASDSFLSIPQNDKVLIYKFTNNFFEPHQTLTSENVTQVSSFHIGFKSFLAIGGGGAGIYRFSKKGLVWEQMEALNTESVNLWLPVQVKTYRDEIFLIMQRSLHHGSHRSYFLEIVTYDGTKFIPHEEIACSFFGEVEHGLACMLDEEANYGLIGAAVLSTKDYLGVLVPRNGTSSLFMIQTAMKPLPSPLEIQVEKLKETRGRLQEMIDEQKLRIEEARENLKYAIKMNEPNIVSAPWRVNTLSAPALRENLQAAVPEEVVEVEEIDVEDLKSELEEIRIGLDNAKRNLVNAVPLNKDEYHFDELVLNGVLEVPGESKIKSAAVESFNNDSVLEIFNDLVRKGDMKSIPSHKTFMDLEVVNLNTHFINGVDVSNRIFNTGAPIKRDVIFSQPIRVRGDITVNGLVNDRDLVNEIVETNKNQDVPLDLQFYEVEATSAQINSLPSQISMGFGRGDTDSLDVAELTVDILDFPGNLTVENVNGENFNEFLKNLCFTNLETQIPDVVKIDGALNVIESSVVFLNGLKFPEEYLTQNSELSTITGNKTFKGHISTDVLRTDGLVNGVNTQDYISLTEDQFIKGTFTFHDLEITETFEVLGDITGPSSDVFLENTILSDANEVKAKVHFKTLQVEGNVIVSNFNQVDLREILADVLYKGEEGIITAIKDFPAGFTIYNGLEVESGSINSIPLSAFVTKNTEQTLSLKTLNGPVSFENLLLTGLYGDVNITKLDQETVKLTGEQFISSSLTFIDNNDDLAGISTEDLKITQTLNNLSVKEYFFATGESRKLNNALSFDTVSVQSMYVDGNVSGELTDFSVVNFDNRRLSYTKDQLVNAEYKLDYLEADDLKPVYINEVPFQKLFNFQFYSEKISELLFEGKLFIKNLHVNGSVYADLINGENMKDVMKGSIWIDRDNNFNTAIFEGNVEIQNLNLKNFNGVDFNTLLENIVYKTEDHPVINSFKIFENGFTVQRMLNSEHLNDVHVDNIMTKTGRQEIIAPLNIKGNVFIKSDCEVETLNTISIPHVADFYQFADGGCTVNGDLLLNRLPYIDNLIVNGFANDIPLEEFLQNMVYKNEDRDISGRITFTQPVIINQNLAIRGTINEVDFSDFVEDMVFITRDDNIEASVVFSKPVFIDDELIVDGNLNTRFLRGVDLVIWNERAAFINKGQIPGLLKFSTVTVQGDVNIKHLNDIDLNLLIPLRTDQYINASLKFGELVPFSNVPVRNYVNGVKLPQEYQRTLLTRGDIQTVNHPVAFYGTFIVGKNIEINGLINGKNISEAVTLNTDQNLTASYNFLGSTGIDSDLLVSDVNGVDPMNWNDRSVKRHADYPQMIMDDWVVKGNVTFEKGVVGEGLIGKMDPRDIMEQLNLKRLSRSSAEEVVMRNYESMCNDVNTIMGISQNQIHLFRYLDYLQILEFENDVGYFNVFEDVKGTFILINENGSCNSHLFIWSKSQFREIKLVETGSISQAISVYDTNLHFLVTRGDNTNCPAQGTNVWKFDLDNFIHLLKIEDQQLLQESFVPRTFYGLDKNTVTEFKLITTTETNVRKYRKWEIETENLIFVPRGLGTGLALTNGHKLFKLFREDFEVQNEFNPDVETVIRGKVVEEINRFVPVRPEGDVLVINVGWEGSRRPLFAVTHHEETSVKGNLDFIKIYEDITIGRVFHKVPSYKPSALVCLEFESGETLLLFLEDQKTLQVFEYKGIEGFKHRLSIKMEGSKLVAIDIPSEMYMHPQKIIGVINKNVVSIFEAVVTGNQLEMERQNCVL